MAEVDERLTDLAAASAYSAPAVQATASNPQVGLREALRRLYTDVAPAQAAVVTQIILKDLKPLLYPITEAQEHYTAALLQYNSNATARLSKWEAMRAWDPSKRMLAAYRVRACLDEAAAMYEHVNDSDAGLEYFQPQVGIPIQVRSPELLTPWI